MFRLQIAMVLSSLLFGSIVPTTGRDSDTDTKKNRVHLTATPPRASGLAELDSFASDRDEKATKYSQPDPVSSSWADEVDAKLASLRTDVDALRGVSGAAKAPAGVSVKEATISSTMAPGDVVAALQRLGFNANGGQTQAAVFRSGGSSGTATVSGGSSGGTVASSGAGFYSPVSYETSAYSVPVQAPVYQATVQAQAYVPVKSAVQSTYRTGPLGRVRYSAPRYSAGSSCVQLADGTWVCP